MKTSRLTRSAAARLLGTSRPTLISIDATHPHLAPKKRNKTSVEYTLDQLAEVSRMMQVEPNLKEADKLGISKQQLLGFYVSLPSPSTVRPSSDFAEQATLALGICEQLKLLADGVYRDLPRNLQAALLNGVNHHKPKVLMIASILASLQET